MKENLKSEQPPSAESIARQADKGLDISSHFTNDGRMMPPIVGMDSDENVIDELNKE